MVIVLVTPIPTSTRLDRLLSSELRISRSRLQKLNEDGFLQATSDRANAMRRHIKTGTVITIDLSDEADREQSWKPLATGGPL